MRILQVTTLGRSLARFLLPLAEGLREAGWQVDAAARGVGDEPACAEAFDRVFELPLSRRPFDPRNLTAAVSRLRSICTAGRYDIVHAHTPVAGFVARYALRHGAPPAAGTAGPGGGQPERPSSRRLPILIYTAHGFHFRKGGRRAANVFFLAAEKLAGRWTDHLVVVNEEDYRAAARHRIVPPDRLHLIPGVGIDTSVYHPSMAGMQETAGVRAEMGIPDGVPLFLVPAEFMPHKRQCDALRALKILIGRGVPAYIAFAGRGPTIGKVRALARDLGIEQWVRVLGFRSDVPLLMRAAVAVVQPSEREGLSRVVMEALSLETPVVGCDVRGVRDLLGGQVGGLLRIQVREHGLTVPPRDPDSLARAMGWVLTHQEEATEMARSGRARVVRDLEVGGIVGRYVRLYETALRGVDEPGSGIVERV